MYKTVKCLECNKTYNCITENTDFSGTIIKTTCPHCNKTTSRNISKFLEIQTIHMSHFEQARTMIEMARSIDRSVNAQNYNVKKHKKTTHGSV